MSVSFLFLRDKIAGNCLLVMHRSVSSVQMFFMAHIQGRKRLFCFLPLVFSLICDGSEAGVSQHGINIP